MVKAWKGSCRVTDPVVVTGYKEDSQRCQSSEPRDGRRVDSNSTLQHDLSESIKGSVTNGNRSTQL